jgi:hypothetical protein
MASAIGRCVANLISWPRARSRWHPHAFTVENCDVYMTWGAGRGEIIPKLLGLLAFSCPVIECYMSRK